MLHILHHVVFNDHHASLDSPVGPTFDLSAFKDGLEVIVPQPLTIRVPITGYPTPVAKWTFGETELTTTDERITVTTKSTFVELVVTPSVRPDKGTYTLQLENDVTSVSGEIEVNVIGTVKTHLLNRQDELSLTGLDVEAVVSLSCFPQRRPALQRTSRCWR